MAEQRNLTQENVKEVKRIFKQMQEEVPDLEYWFCPQKKEAKSDTLELITITKEIKEKLADSLEQKSEPKFDFDGHVLMLDSQRAIRVILEQRGRLGYGYIVEQVQMSSGRLPVPVRGLVLNHEHERLGLVAFVFQPVHRQALDDVGRVSDVPDSLSIIFTGTVGVLEHCRVVVRSLADEHFGVVIALRRHVRAEVPLADHRCLVAGFLQELGESLLRAVELLAVVDDAVDVAVLAGKDDGPAGRAYRIGAEAILKEHTFCGQAVEIGGLVYLASVAAHCMGRVVVAHNKDDIWPLSEAVA